MEKFVTVLMPVYNGASYVREAIDSILSQTYNNFEFLIINDGSTDNTEQIVLSYDDERIRYIKNSENIKLIASLNKGLNLAEGKYIVRMDADDLSTPDRLKYLVDYMEQHSECAVCGSWAETFPNGGIVEYPTNNNDIKFRMFNDMAVIHASTIIRKSSIANMCFDAEYAHAEDYDFFTRVIKSNKIANIPNVLYKIRHHPSQVSEVFHKIQQDNSLKVRKNIFRYINTIITDELLSDYSHLCYQEYRSVSESPIKIKELLQSMIKGNEQTGYIEKDFFNNKVKEIWFHYTYNNGLYKEYHYTPELKLEKYICPGIKLRFIIRRFLNYFEK